MKKVKMYFGKLPIPEKIQKARNLATRMEGNTAFTNPQPALADITAAAAKLEDAYEVALNGGKIQVAFMHQCESVLHSLIVSLASYVQCVSMGDETIILSSGFDVRGAHAPAREAATPLNVNGKPGTHEGEVILTWDAVPGARAYSIQTSSDGVSNWTFFGTATKRRVRISGLESWTKCFFRVAAIGPLGQSGWSDPGMGRVF